jgi:hypothetical protein
VGRLINGAEATGSDGLPDAIFTAAESASHDQSWR